MPVRAVYAAIMPDGRVVKTAPNVTAAAAALKAAGHRGTVHTTEADPEGPRSNPPEQVDTRKVLRLAMMRLGLDPISRAAVKAMTVEQAFDEILPILALVGTTNQSLLKKCELPPDTMTSPEGFIEGLLGKNYKTGKSGTGLSSPWSRADKADVVGLSLMPADRVFKFLNESATGKVAHEVSANALDMARYVERLAQKGKLGPPTNPALFSTCSMSNGACRSTCLDLSGNNPTEWFKVLRKAALTLALVQHPVAFLRLLAAAIEEHFKTARADTIGRRRSVADVYRFVRLNVFSDVPWEILAPWLFEIGASMPKVGFYDYTKIPGRPSMPGFPDNYDLTFSFAGTNEWLTERALHEDRTRVAVVFMSHHSKDGEWAPVTVRPSAQRAPMPSADMDADAYKQAAKQAAKRAKVTGSPDPIETIPVGGEMWGVPVIHGDIHDVRPFDPPSALSKARGSPVVVGLAFKAPNTGGWAANTKAGYLRWLGLSESTRAEKPPAFIYPSYIVSGVTRVGSRSGGEFLVAAVSPQQEPIAEAAK